MESNGHEILISADSHVMEPHDLWEKGVPEALRADAPRFKPIPVGESFQKHPGGQDPHARIKEMETDGLSAEVLYPTLALTLFALDDARMQEACFRVYNDWLINYCRIAPKRLVGSAAISLYDAERGIAEMERCKKGGLNGVTIWEVPHPDLPFHSDHYNKFWDAAADMEMPVSLHILTGHSYFKDPNRRQGVEHYRGSVNLKLLDNANALFELIFYGILKHHPKLKIVIVEAEVGWLPFLLQQWDYYWRRFKDRNPPPIDEEPSAYFKRQVYATFFNDSVGGRCLEWWGAENCMWSNDFPHENSTWPNSRKVIQRDLGYLPPDRRAKLVCLNVAKLYNLEIPAA
jgi:predicted TIM-barrel fold metal-dependent hydrolase